MMFAVAFRDNDKMILDLDRESNRRYLEILKDTGYQTVTFESLDNAKAFAAIL